MQTNTVYIIEEDGYGLRGVADSKAAAFSFLISRKKLTADTRCGYSWHDDRTLAEICKEEGITKENFIDWAVFKLENTNFWDHSDFSIYEKTLYTEKTI
jgi:hypothetical protein